MEPPIEPKKEDCCNSGCNPCIFDIYEKQLKQYENYLKDGIKINDSQENGIAQLEYTEFIVVKNINVCKSHHLIFLRRPTSVVRKVWWKPGDHFLFKYTSNEVSFTRAYTPIVLNDEPRDDYDFAIIVKEYENGIVSTFLCKLEIGCSSLWRGPYGNYEIRPNLFDRIIMIAQGTGIAPFISIIDHILCNEDDITRIILLYCCKCEDTILFRNELYEYKSYWNFKYEIYLSDTSTNVKIRYHEPIKQYKLNIDYLYNYKPFVNKDQILICGSPQFNEHYDSLIRKEQPEIENIILF